MSVSFVEPGKLEPGSRFRLRVGRRVSELVEMVLLFGLIADEGRAAQDRPPCTGLGSAPRS
jgi:hypothetical protein